MIRVLFKQLLDEKSFQERKRITVSEVSRETGISRATLTRIANIPGYNTNTDTLNSLCRYFDCKPGDLLEIRDDDQ
ncbi:MAG: helix-turn-helix transcriptional regulator [Candidatus Thiodiazotropha endolucinida]|nr:helix-turn-helix transcriptional regulator [Candidatus Thiodiazotropha taylori]MCG8094928.1 helix-turn-helix transcriptional regulator [Candidatus Thiodiazotropha endolucinida]MCG8045966.1 helix-turn-helix transcriptional regulator [Candidatus Thiodiazotropha taylori]MCG8052883.1 helix-turn-helix transcriptional regulator [Candidatus Thiodiazotropha taylori]MCG8071216.1 helix-turn-helix transcriptional regulator [Candidatus Thiodiazotropha taylori]